MVTDASARDPPLERSLRRLLSVTLAGPVTKHAQCSTESPSRIQRLGKKHLCFGLDGLPSTDGRLPQKLL